MTFIANMYHHNFSLMVADRKASTDGETVLKAGSTTITIKGKADIIGFEKIFLNANSGSSLAIAGDANEHRYLDKFKETNSPDESISVIDSAMANYHSILTREDMIDKNQVDQNEGLLSFYDTKLARFFTCIFSFSMVHKYLQLYRAPDEGLRIASYGSGQNIFNEIFNLDAFSNLAKEIKNDPVENCIKYLEPIYKTISQRDTHVSSSIVAYMATRNAPVFKEVYRSYD